MGAPSFERPVSIHVQCLAVQEGCMLWKPLRYPRSAAPSPPAAAPAPVPHAFEPAVGLCRVQHWVVWRGV